MQLGTLKGSLTCACINNFSFYLLGRFSVGTSRGHKDHRYLFTPLRSIAELGYFIMRKKEKGGVETSRGKRDA